MTRSNALLSTHYPYPFPPYHQTKNTANRGLKLDPLSLTGYNEGRHRRRSSGTSGGGREEDEEEEEEEEESGGEHEQREEEEQEEGGGEREEKPSIQAAIELVQLQSVVEDLNEQLAKARLDRDAVVEELNEQLERAKFDRDEALRSSYRLEIDMVSEGSRMSSHSSSYSSSSSDSSNCSSSSNKRAYLHGCWYPAGSTRR